MGYFDYVKSCISENGMIPFTISARQEKCRNDFTCITEVIVSIANENGDDNLFISYPNSGNPVFKDSNSDAIGSYTFSDANSGKIGSYIVGKNTFEVSFDYNGLVAKLKFYYKSRFLTIETTDCLIGSDLNLCGLCGNINNDDGDDFIRCDDLEQINNTNSHLKRPRTSSIVSEAWANTHEFGHSCCNSELESNYLDGISTTCEGVTPEKPDTDCLNAAETLCQEAWQLYCIDCSESTQQVTEEWLTQCSMDFCQVDNCATNVVYNTGMTLNDAISKGCLDTSLEQCYLSSQLALDDIFEHVLDL